MNEKEKYSAIAAGRAGLSAKDIEAGVISALVGYRNAYDAVQDKLDELCFTEPLHISMFKAIKEVAESGTHPDMLAVSQKIKTIDPNIKEYEVAEICGSNNCLDLDYSVEILIAYKKKRIAFVTAATLAADATKDDVDINQITDDAIAALLSSATSGLAEDITMSQVLDNLLGHIKENASPTAKPKGSFTGFPFIDNKGGLKYSSLIIIAAETSQGKSSLALNLSMSALLHGAKVAFYSMEMTNEELVARVLSSKSNVPSSAIMYSRLYDDEQNKVYQAAANIKNIGRNMHFDDRSDSGIDTILSSIRNKKKKFNIDGVVLDYMQILNVNMKNGNKEQAMGEVARKLKNIAKELNIWVIALSQLSRDREHPEPSMSRLRDSGQIAEAADEVYLIYRPEAAGQSSYSGDFSKYDIHDTAMIIRAKGRGIGIGRWLVGFDAATTTFKPLDAIPEVAVTKSEDDDAPF